MLDPDRIAKLSSLGFSFAPRPRISFDDRAVQWLQYRNEHGRDPGKLAPGGVWSWIQTMRKYYKGFQKGEKVPITAEQFDQLKKWGFKFECGLKKATNPAKRKSWEDRFEELVQYKEEHGHVNIPQKCEYKVAIQRLLIVVYSRFRHLIEDPILGNWVKTQRKEYSHFKAGEKSLMSQERIDRLVQIRYKEETTTERWYKSRSLWRRVRWKVWE